MLERYPPPTKICFVVESKHEKCTSRKKCHKKLDILVLSLVKYGKEW